MAKAYIEINETVLTLEQYEALTVECHKINTMFLPLRPDYYCILNKGHGGTYHEDAHRNTWTNTDG